MVMVGVFLVLWLLAGWARLGALLRVVGVVVVVDIVVVIGVMVIAGYDLSLLLLLVPLLLLCFGGVF